MFECQRAELHEKIEDSGLFFARVRPVRVPHMLDLMGTH